MEPAIPLLLYRLLPNQNITLQHIPKTLHGEIGSGYVDDVSKRLKEHEPNMSAETAAKNATLYPFYRH